MMVLEMVYEIKADWATPMALSATRIYVAFSTSQNQMLIIFNYCWCSSLPISLCLNAFIFILGIRSAYYSDSWPSIKFWSYHILLFVANPSDGSKTMNRSRNQSRASVINLTSRLSDMPKLIERSISVCPSETVVFAAVAFSSSSSAAAAAPPSPTSSSCALLRIPSVSSAATSLLRCLECRKAGPVLAGHAEWTVLYSPCLGVVILHKTSPVGLAKQLYTISWPGPISSENFPEYRSWLESFAIGPVLQPDHVRSECSLGIWRTAEIVKMLSTKVLNPCGQFISFRYISSSSTRRNTITTAYATAVRSLGCRELAFLVVIVQDLFPDISLLWVRFGGCLYCEVWLTISWFEGIS